MIDMGVQMSWPSSALPYLTSNHSEILITFEQSTWLASVDSMSAILGIVLFPFLMDRIGRKYTLLFFGCLQILACILTNTATSFTYLCIARIVSGIGYGGNTSFICIYIGEIADKSIRGTLLSLDKTCVNFGGFLLNTAGAFLSYKTMNLVTISIPLLALATFPFTYETPYYYLLKRRDDDAVKTLMKLSGKTESELVMVDINRMRDSIEKCHHAKKNAIQTLFTDKGSRRAFIILSITNVTYAFSGFLTIQSYAQDIFEQTGSSMNPAYSAMIISGVQVLIGPFSSYLVDHWGRKVTYLLSGISCSIFLSIVGCYFFFEVSKQVDVSSITWIPLVALTFFQVMCSMGLSTLPYIYSGELFSMKVKGMSIMLSSILISICLFISKFMAPFVVKAAGLYTLFWMFACVCIIGPLVILFVAPETKGKNLENILEIMRAKKI